MFMYSEQQVIVVTIDSGGNVTRTQGIDEVNQLLGTGEWEVAEVTPLPSIEGNKQVAIMVLGKLDPDAE